MSDRNHPDHDGGEQAERARLDAVSARLQAIEDERARRQPGSAAREAQRGQRQAWRILSEFLTAVAVGSLAGHFLVDRVFDTTPWGLIAGVFAGFGLGMVMMARAGARTQRDTPGDDNGR
jgi:ATP synthase protein I